MILKDSLQKIPLEAQKIIVASETVRQLEEIILLLKEGKYSDLNNMIEFSPEGDGWGCENHYISFTSDLYRQRIEGNIDFPYDIGDILNFLQSGDSNP